MWTIVLPVLHGLRAICDLRRDQHIDLPKTTSVGTLWVTTGTEIVLHDANAVVVPPIPIQPIVNLDDDDVGTQSEGSVSASDCSSTSREGEDNRCRTLFISVPLSYDSVWPSASDNDDTHPTGNPINLYDMGSEAGSFIGEDEEVGWARLVS
jgi:hypothetical protein